MSSSAQQGVSAETLRSISTPDRVGSRLGTLDFVDGFPSRETSELVYDHLDFVHALNVFLNGFAGASTYALPRASTRRGRRTTRS
jgi:hypothetical protein